MENNRHERAWFRSGARTAWHAVSRRNDVLLEAACGYARDWVRVEQVRGTRPPGEACQRCIERLRRPGAG